MITSQNIIYHEIIGLNVFVLESTDNTLVGVSGEVVDETKNTLKIRTTNGIKTISKTIVKLNVEIPNGEKTIIKGNEIALRPENRIGKLKKLR
ncbi:MAG TPA: ribonuclease P protein component 1 [Nitrososphaerales archaeon]